jgi:hypothetical protein
MKKRSFDPREFLATIGQGRKVVPFPKKQPIFARGTQLTQSSTSRKAKSDSLLYPMLARKQPSAYWARVTFSEKAAWLDSLYAWVPQPQ